MSEPVGMVRGVTTHEPNGQPHDALFRLVFGDPDNTASELRSVLPPRLAARIDLANLRPQPGTFVDPELRHRHTDLLFRTRVPVAGVLSPTSPTLSTPTLIS